MQPRKRHPRFLCFFFALLASGGTVFAYSPSPVIEHDWTFFMGGSLFGIHQVGPIIMPANQFMPEETIIMPRTITFHCGHWSASIEGYDAPTLILWVLAGLVAVVALAILVWRRRKARQA